MNPVLLTGLIAAATVIVVWSGANLLRWATDRARRRQAERHGGLLEDFSSLPARRRP